MSTEAPVDRILRALEAHGCEPRKTGTGWQARCPAHEDRRASLSISIGEDGRALICCHSGCEHNAVLPPLGLAARDMFTEADVPHNGGSRIIATYDYQDRNRKPVYQAVRHDPKDFRFRRPDGNGGWIWNLKDVPRFLYRLPELHAADPGEIVFVVEGEKDADRLVAAGVVATTNPGGAGKWRPEFNETLRDRHVVILPDNDPPGRKHAQQVASSLHGVAASVTVLELPGLPPKGDVSDWLDAGHTIEELRELAGKAPEWEAPAGAGVEPEPRPEIRITADAPAVVDAAQDALIASGCAIFSRGRLLVEVSRQARKLPWLARPTGAPAIVPIASARLRELLAASACWMTERGKPGRKGGEATDPVLEPALPPTWTVEMLAARPQWGFPEITMITETPLLGADGRIIEKPGYDEETGVLFLPGEPAFSSVPASPTLEDARAAIRIIKEPLADFPFVQESDRSAAISPILTLLARPAFTGPAPAFNIDAPVQGTGKTLLADVISTAATGRPAPKMPAPSDEAEAGKRILAIAIEGLRVVVLDNIAGTLTSPTLAAALTATEWQDRLLGRNETITAPLTTVWIITANNPTFSSDIARRLIPINLDPRVEDPETRTGWLHPDLRGYVEQERPRLVVAALTILRAFHVAGRPGHGLPPMGSFEGWDSLIRAALIWTGEADPLAGRQRIREQMDVERDGLREGLGAWDKAFGPEAMTAAEAVARAEKDHELAAGLAALAGCTASKLDSRRLGYGLRRGAARIVEGRVLDRESGNTHGASRWTLRKAGG